jgi:hypothetical protein
MANQKNVMSGVGVTVIAAATLAGSLCLSSPALAAINDKSGSASVDGTTSAQVTITVKDPAAVMPFAVTAPTNGSTHKGESTRFSGTGTAGDTVTVKVTNFTSTDVTTTVKQDGTWSVDKFLGTGAYTIDVVQTNPAGAETGAVRALKINQPTENPGQNLPFKVTTPTAGSAHRGEYTEFSGEGRSGETVTVHVTNFTSDDVTTTVKQDGTWSVKKFTGIGTYVFDITQKNAAGTQTGTVTNLTINPAA